MLLYLQTRTRRDARAEDTRRSRELIGRYRDGFIDLYGFERIKIEGTQSNLEAYAAKHMTTAYKTHAAKNSSRYLLNLMKAKLDTRSLRKQIRRRIISVEEKRDLREQLDKIGRFKKRIFNTSGYAEINHNRAVIENEFGPWFGFVLDSISPILEAIGQYEKGSHWNVH